MEYRKAYLILIIGVVAASGCIDQSSETELMSINYEPPSEFETSLSYLGLGIEEFRPENTSSSQIYDDGNRNYIYAGRVRFNPNNFYTNESVEGLKGFFQNQSSDRKRINNISTKITTIDGEKYVNLNFTGQDLRDEPNLKMEWNWTKKMLFREENNEIYGFILTDTKGYYTSRNTSRSDTFRASDSSYTAFLDSVKSAEIN